MKRIMTVAAIAVTQLALVGAGVAPQLSARLTGETYLVRVELFDPIDPWRGAYVALSYPDLDAMDTDVEDGEPVSSRSGVFIPLRREGEVWVGGERQDRRPASGPYLACSSGWAVDCGIESWFVPQDEATRMEQTLADGAYAEIRVDGRGHAALVGIRDGD